MKPKDLGILAWFLVVMIGCTSSPVHITKTYQPTPILATSTLFPSHTPSSIVVGPTQPHPTLALAPTVTPMSTINPLTPNPPALDGHINVTYSLESEQTIGDYIVRVWYVPTQTIEFIGKAITLAKEGKAIFVIESISEISPLTGTDINGDGLSDIVVTLATGGANCCFSYLAYGLGMEPIEVLRSPYSEFSGEFNDLDGDGDLEFLTFDDPLNSYCGYPTALSVQTIYQYQNGKYQPASPNFKQSYTDDISKNILLAANAQPTIGDWDGTTKCSVLPLILDYLYSGQDDKAWEALALYYAYPDLEALKTDIQKLVEASPNFIATREISP